MPLQVLLQSLFFGQLLHIQPWHMQVILLKRDELLSILKGAIWII